MCPAFVCNGGPSFSLLALGTATTISLIILLLFAHYLCVYSHHLLDLLVLKGRHGIFNVCNMILAHAACIKVRQVEESPQMLTWKS